MKSKKNFDGLVEPKTTSLVGEVVKISHVSFEDRDARCITIQTKDGVNNDVWFGENQMQAFELSSTMFVGNVISVTMEHRIASVTEYIDDVTGNVETHKTTADCGVNATNAGNMVLFGLGFNHDFVDMINQLRTNAGTKSVRASVLVAPTNADELKTAIETLTKRLNGLSNDIVKDSIVRKIASLEKQLESIK